MAAAVAAIALAGGCGTHPGAAADVDGTRIALNDVDAYTEALCEATTAFAGTAANTVGAEAVNRQELRQQIVGVLVRLELARDAADDLGVEVSAADLDVDEEALPPVVQDLEADQRDALVELFGYSQELNAINAAIGTEVDPDGESPDPVAAGQDYVNERLPDADITVDPRIGLDSGLEVSDDQGMSVLGGEAPELPATQTCG